MAFSLKKISDICKTYRLTVYGYIRNYEKINQIEIPEEIVLVLILFYGYEKDEWDPKHIAENTKLSDGTLTQIRDGWASSYGKQIVDSGIFKWLLKINEGENNGFIIGIRKIGKDENDLPRNTWFTKGGYHKGYGFRIRSGLACLTDDEGYACGNQYGIEPSNGSTIEMILDLDNLTLGYIIDGIDYGKAFDVTAGKYRLGLYMNGGGNSITLL